MKTITLALWILAIMINFLAGCMSDGQPRTFDGMFHDPIRDGFSKPDTNTFEVYPPPKK